MTVKVLADGEKIIPDRAYFTDRDGVIDAMFAIGDAEGNISVVVVRKEFADQTAEVVVRGAKKSEREAIVASPLGPHVWNAALLSFAATDIPVRGMHFAQGDSVDTPITVDAVIGKTVVVTVLKDAPIIKFAIVDGATGTVHEVVHEDVTKGQTIDMPVSGPMSIVAIGAWFSDENGNVSPWEGWFTAMKPSDLTVTVEVPQRVEPGTEVQIRLKTNRLDKTVSVIVVVQDDRHAQTVTANYALAATMQEILRQMGAELRVGEPLEKIAVTDDDEDYGMRGGVVKASRLGRHEMYRSGPQLQPTGVRYWKYDVVLESAMGAAPTILPLVAALVKSLSGRKKTGKTLYAQIVLVNSEATVSVNVGDEIAGYRISAFAVLEADWQEVFAHVQVQKSVSAELVAPVDVRDTQVAKTGIHVVSESGKATVIAALGGSDVQVRDASGNVVSVVHTPCDLFVLTGSGELRVNVVDEGSGKEDTVTTTIHKMGKMKHDVRRLKVLQEGEKVSQSALNAVSTWVLPGLNAPFTALTQALAAYVHDCCQQTSAKMWAAIFAAIQDDEAGYPYYRTGAERMHSMALFDGGFKMYPESPNVRDDHWGLQAARNLWRMRIFHDDHRLVGFRELVSDMMRLGKSAMQCYPSEQLMIVSPKSCEEAYFWCMQDASNVSKAALFVALRIANGSVPSLSGRGIVSQRAETAYAVAVLLKNGRIDAAITLANQVIAQFNAEGRLHSPEDSLAALVMMGELARAGVVSSGADARVKVNGKVYSLAEAIANPPATIYEVSAVKGTIVVEYVTVIEEDWFTGRSNIPVSASVRRGTQSTTILKVGDTDVSLVVDLGVYKPGTLLQIALPNSLCVLQGGTQTFVLVVDPRGQSTVTIPLHVLAPSYQSPLMDVGPVSIVVKATSMFEEEDGGLAEVLVTVL